MPELPEVETICRALAPQLVGQRIDALEVLDERWCAPQSVAELERGAVGRRIEGLHRRGKYFDFALEGDRDLVMHLRMTGTLLLDPPGVVPHTRVLASIGGRRLLFVDPRRFGTGQLLSGSEERERFFESRLGLEPLGGQLDGALLRRLTHTRRQPIKAFLLDQRRVAGIGNIYADEALFRCGVHPLREAGKLRPRQYDLLADAIRDVLAEGIDAKGASIDDFRDPDGARGTFQDRFRVHRRAGLLCHTCGSAIEKLVVGGRGTYVCSHCQPPPRAKRQHARVGGAAGHA